MHLKNCAKIPIFSDIDNKNSNKGEKLTLIIKSSSWFPAILQLKLRVES